LKILVFSGGAITAGSQKMQEDIFVAGLFTTTLTIKAALGSEVKYKFKAYPDERFENGGGYETGSDRIYVWSGTDSTLPIVQPNIIAKSPGVPHDVTIKFIVDMNSAVDIKTSQPITVPRDVWIKGGPAPLGAWGGNWTYDDTTGGTLKPLFDDGTHGDALAGDKFFTAEIVWPTGTPGGAFEFKYAAGYTGVEGGGSAYLDNEAGYATNHSWTIPNPPATYYTLRTVFGTMGLVGVRELNNSIPTIYSLSQNYPNPFNPTTHIEFSIPTDNFVTLKVYNLVGQEVSTLVSDQMKAGNYQVTLNATNLASGVYFYKLVTGSFASIKKLTFLK
jgi:hypothetical protein